MSRGYTLVQAGSGRDRYEAIYCDGTYLAAGEDGALTAAEVLEALAHSNISVQVSYVEISEDYDEKVISMSGWPIGLEEIPEEARL